MPHLAQGLPDGFRLGLLDTDIVRHGSVLFRHESLPRIGKLLRQELADPLPRPVGIGQDDDAPFMVRRLYLPQRTGAQGETASLDGFAVQGAAHCHRVHFPFDNQDFFQQWSLSFYRI